MDTNTIITIVIFLATMVCIMTEIIPRAVAALAGGTLMILFKVMSGEEAFAYIDLNTIGVLIGMMVSVGIIKKAGLFEYVAIWAARITKANPWRIILAFSVITAITSALLDNVTTVLLIAPMTLVITETLEMDPIPFLIPEILASNIGGTATLIGDPPNIMIGSAAGLGFADFIVNLLPASIVIFVVTFLILRVIYRKKLAVSDELRLKIMGFDPKKSITDKRLAIKSIAALILITLGFFLHEFFHYPSSVVALSGAVLLMIITREDVEEAFKNVEWTVIFFFAGLFMVVGGLEAKGIMNDLATGIIQLTDGDPVMTGMSLVWVSAFSSAFVDNIPFVATVIPLVKAIGHTGHTSINAFWWAVSLGACLGGNGTLIGASANIVVAGIAKKQGYDLSFKKFFVVGFPMMIISIILASIYLLIFYL